MFLESVGDCSSYRPPVPILVEVDDGRGSSGHEVLVDVDAHDPHSHRPARRTRSAGRQRRPPPSAQWDAESRAGSRTGRSVRSRSTPSRSAHVRRRATPAPPRREPTPPPRPRSRSRGPRMHRVRTEPAPARRPRSRHAPLLHEPPSFQEWVQLSPSARSRLSSRPHAMPPQRRTASSPSRQLGAAEARRATPSFRFTEGARRHSSPSRTSSRSVYNSMVRQHSSPAQVTRHHHQERSKSRGSQSRTSTPQRERERERERGRGRSITPRGRGRPVTPSRSVSRPITPRGSMSRPITPRGMASRPVTPRKARSGTPHSVGRRTVTAEGGKRGHRW